MAGDPKDTTPVHELLTQLGPKAQRGSKPRCHWLTHGTKSEVARRLTALAEGWARVSAHDEWMPLGFDKTGEAELHKADLLLNRDICNLLGHWWLPPDRQTATVPVFDIASTCTIENKRGLLLVEAKAHDTELSREAGGRSLNEDATDARKASHSTIGAAITAAKEGLSDATSLDWQISRDSHYQMSNRFAWSWKLAECGIPVVLVYLGFLNANEMTDLGVPFSSHERWEALIRSHSKGLVPDEVWNRRWQINGTSFIPIIGSVEQPLVPQSR